MISWENKGIFIVVLELNQPPQSFDLFVAFDPELIQRCLKRVEKRTGHEQYHLLAKILELEEQKGDGRRFLLDVYSYSQDSFISSQIVKAFALEPLSQ
jgi:hypothetical protein